MNQEDKDAFLKPNAEKGKAFMKRHKSLTVLAGIIAIIFIISAVGNSKPKVDPEYAAKLKIAEQRVAEKQAESERKQAEQDAAELAAWKTSKAGILCSKHQSWTKDDCDKLINEKIWIGMSYDMLTYLIGKPDHINPSNYGSGTQYQYCWSDNTPNCFYDNNNDGMIDAYN